MYKKNGYDNYEQYLNANAGLEILSGLDSKKITAMSSKKAGTILRKIDPYTFKLGYNSWRRVNANKLKGGDYVYYAPPQNVGSGKFYRYDPHNEGLDAYGKVTLIELKDSSLGMSADPSKLIKATPEEARILEKHYGHSTVTAADGKYYLVTFYDGEEEYKIMSKSMKKIKEKEEGVKEVKEITENEFSEALDKSKVKAQAEGQSLSNKVKDFMSKDPSEDEIETFYVNDVLPYDRRSINEILEDSDEISVEAALLEDQKVDSFEKDVYEIAKKYDMTIEDVIDNIDTFILPATVSASRKVKSKKKKIKASLQDYFNIDELNDDDFNEVYEAYGYADDEGLTRDQKKELLLPELERKYNDIKDSFEDWKSAKEDDGKNWKHIIYMSDYDFDNALKRYIEENDNPIQLDEDISDEAWEEGLQYYMDSYAVYDSADGHGFIMSDGTEVGQAGGDHNSIPHMERMEEGIVTTMSSGDSINLRLLENMTFPQWGTVKRLVADSGASIVYYDVYNKSGDSIDNGSIDAEDLARAARKYVSARKIESILAGLRPVAELKEPREVHIVALDAPRALLEIADGSYEIPGTDEMVLIFDSGTDALEMAEASFPEYDYPKVLKEIVEKEKEIFEQSEDVSQYLKDFSESDRYNEMDMAHNVGMCELENNEEDGDIIL